MADPRSQILDKYTTNGHVEVVLAFSDFEDWCRRLGKVPTSLGLPGLRTWCNGAVPAEVAAEWAHLLSVRVEDIWGPRGIARAEMSTISDTDTESGEATEIPDFRGGTAKIPRFPAISPRNRDDDAKRKADCRAAVVRAYRAWHDEMASWLEIENLNRARVDLVNELVAAHTVLKKELRATEAWYGALTFAEVLAGLVLEIDLTEQEQQP
jgi:hypothetical protein